MAWRNGLALIVCVLMCTRSVGFLLESPEFRGFGAQLHFSPLPIPFRDLGNGFENYVHHIEARIRLADGTIIETSDVRELLDRIAGPHRFKITHSVAVNRGPVLASRFRQPVYQYFFCRVTDWEHEVRHMTFTHTNRRTGESVGTVSYACR